MIKRSNKIFFSNRDVYYFTLVLLAMSLPLSIFTTTLAEIILVLNWIVEGNFSQKIAILKYRKSVLPVFLIYLIHLIGMIHSSDLSYGFHDLKIKLPTLILPLVICTSASLNEKEIRNLFILFSLAVFGSTLISGSIYFNLTNREILDYREISIFISHIRLALMVDLALFSLLYLVFTGNREIRLIWQLQWPSVIIIAWFIVFLVILKSITGLTILICVAFILGWKYSGRIRDIAPRFIIRIFIITIPLLIATYVSHAIEKYFRTDNLNFEELDQTTKQGNPYYHDVQNRLTENGHFVYLYICEKELREEWNKISTLSYDGRDRKGQTLKFTLFRYLTSKNLRKDAEGLNNLSRADIKAIENGLTNYIFLHKFSIYARIYEIIWELDSFSRGDDPSGHSVAQRIIYLKAAWEIISQHPVFGVGTGDLKSAYDAYYENSGNMISEEWRFRAHNQFVTFIITFGLTGFLLILAGFLIPVFLEKKWGDYYFLSFILICFMSFLNEDTLETQTGVSFFMFFYSEIIKLFSRWQICTDPVKSS